MIARKLFYALSPEMRRTVRRFVYYPIDLWDDLTGKRNPMVPPKGKIYTGSGDFIASGKSLMQMCIQLSNLQPNHRVLDIGSGIGRLAIPLTEYLQSGSYEGFDVVEEGVQWCSQQISSRYPHFKFTYVPLRNDLYNLNTVETAANFNFPYQQNEFDLVVLTSVFTHMQQPEVAHYLKEIERVLKPGGYCIFTAFIMNEHTASLLKKNPHLMQFPHQFETYYLHDIKVKDANIALKEKSLEEMIEVAGLQREQFHWGWWRGTPRQESLNFQDVAVLQKPL